jgi:hypothetical protein
MKFGKQNLVDEFDNDPFPVLLGLKIDSSLIYALYLIRHFSSVFSLNQISGTSKTWHTDINMYQRYLRSAHKSPQLLAIRKVIKKLL